MSLTNWLQKFRSSPAPRRRDRKRAQRGSFRAATHPLQLEPLEDRRMLALTAPVQYDVGTGPQEIVTADFNNDGALDLATASYVDSTVSVLLGNSNGAFQPALTFGTGAEPLCIAVGDFDHDGTLDLATASFYDLSILRGNGDGTFQPPASSINLGSYPESVAVGDLNGDGTLDLAVTSNNYYPSYYGYYGYYGYYAGQANVLLGNGDGSFAAPITNWLGYGYHADAVVADFNGDGALDFTAANYDYGTVSVLLGDGSGNLSALADYGVGFYPWSIAAEDVNGDQRADLVVANRYGDDVSVLLGNGLGSFGVAQNYAVGSEPTSVVTGDFNGDDRLDIATADWDANANSTISVLYGQAGGTFSPALTFSSPGAYDLVVGDFNGDGWLDAATANFSWRSLSVLLNDQNWPPAPDSLSIDDVMVTEGNSGTVAAVFTVTRSGNLDAVATVSYTTANGGALAGSDYVADSGTLTFGPGVATMTITILVNGDVTDEFDQGFYVNLSAPSGAVITDGQGFGSILDNDPEPTITITTKVSAKEGNNNHTTSFVFVVTLSAPSEKYVQVNFATANGTATTADGDYVHRSGTLYFAPGVTSQTISVQVKGDKRKESNETFFVNLSGASNATIAAAQAIGEILDDDTSPGKRKS